MSGTAMVAGTVSAAAVLAVGSVAAAARRATARSRLIRRFTPRPAGIGQARRIARPASLLDAVPPPARLPAALARAGVVTPAGRVWSWWLAAVGAAGVLVFAAGGPVAGLLATAAAVAGPVAGLRALAGRDVVLVERALPDALGGLARSLRAGGSVRTALAEVAELVPPPLAADLDRIVRAIDRGVPIPEALDRWATTRDCPGVRLATAALVLGIESGAGLARTLDGVAATLHERAAHQREVRALSTQARYSAGVLAVAPLAFLVVAGGIDRSVVSFLFATPPGLACLTAGLALDAAGGAWMLRITRSAA